VRSRFVGFVAALAVAAVVGLGSAHAAVIVSTASGNIGEFSAVNNGVVGNTATIVFNIPQTQAFINTVNGTFQVPPEPVKVNTPLSLLVTSLGSGNYNLALSPSSAQEIIGATAGQQAIVNFGLSKGSTTTTLPNFFNAAGLTTGLAANLDPNLDFQKFAIPGGTINFTLTATTFSSGIGSFDQFFATAGATAVGNGSFSQVAVPEPSSMALGAVTVVGAAVYRRWRKRSRKA
jgi:hypothetical protein